MIVGQIEGLVEDYAHDAQGEASVIEQGVRAATGTAPHAFGGFVHDYAGAFDEAAG